MFAASLCMLGAAAAELIKPWPIKVIFDAILAPQHNRGWLLEQIGAFISDLQILLATLVGSIFAIAVVAGVFGYGQSYLLSLVGQRVVTSIRIELYSHIQRLSQSFHDERSTGDLMTRLTGDVRMMRELLVNSILTMAARLLIVLGSLAVMFVMDWRLALVAVAVVPALTLASWRFSGRIKGAVRQQRRKESRLAHVMAEGIGAIKVVQAFAREAHEQERFASQNKAGADADVKAARLEAHMERIVQIILACGTCGVVWYGVTRVQAAC